MKLSFAVTFSLAICFVACINAQDQTTGSKDKPAAKTEKKEESKDGKNDKVEQEVVYSKYNKLSRFDSWVLVNKGTERAGTGSLTENKKSGTYICKRCNAALYKSADKFESHCGWPSFDDEIKGAVRRQLDKDGVRTEILCTNCDGHLGHVFLGERFTEKNTRHCVNSASMRFIAEGRKIPAKIRPPSEKKKDQKKIDEQKKQAEKKAESGSAKK